MVFQTGMENAALIPNSDTVRIEYRRTPMDRFVELLAFVRTVDRGSQAAAARELGITPAMVGRYVRALEDRLGTRLLNRTTATQSLTEAGAAFHARAGAVLEQLEAAEQAASDRQAEPRGLLRVNAGVSFGVRYLAAATAEYRALHPGVRLELVLNDRVVDLIEDGYDVVVRIGRLADSVLVARRLASCRVVLCAAPTYLVRHGEPGAPAALSQHDCLRYSLAHSDVWRFAARGSEPATRNGEPAVQRGDMEVRPSGSLVSNNGDALLAAAVAGQGIALLPTFIVGDALRAGRLVRLLPGWQVDSLDLNVVYPSPRHLSPKVRSFVDFLAGRFGDPAPWDAGLDHT